MSIYEFIKNKYNTLRYPIIDERQFDDVVNEIRAESAERIKELEAENKQLKQEVRCLNVKLSDESNNATILAEKLNEMNHAHKHLRDENERIKAFCNELNKDCKWLPTTRTPTINGFETMVQCANGKKRVASFRLFDFHWYDVNNGNKLNVVKWLWQPSIPQGEEGN